MIARRGRPVNRSETMRISLFLLYIAYNLFYEKMRTAHFLIKHIIKVSAAGTRKRWRWEASTARFATLHGGINKV